MLGLIRVDVPIGVVGNTTPCRTLLRQNRVDTRISLACALHHDLLVGMQFDASGRNSTTANRFDYRLYKEQTACRLQVVFLDSLEENFNALHSFCKSQACDRRGT